MSAESRDSTVIQPKVVRIVHLTAFPTLEIGFTVMVTWIMKM